MILLCSTSGSWVQLMTKTSQPPYSSDARGCPEGVPPRSMEKRRAHGWVFPTARVSLHWRLHLVPLL